MALQAGKNGEMLIVLKVRDDGTAVIEKFGEASEREGEKASLSWKKIGGAVGAAAAAVATTAALMVKNSIDNADATGKVADKLGMTTEAYSALAYVAKTTADITRDNFGQAMRMMVDNLSQAAHGTGLAKNAIADLGLNAKQLAGMGPEKAVLAISDAMEKIPNQGDRVRIAMDVFRNADMVNALKGGSAAMREMMDEARRFGQVIGSDAARNADAFNDNIDRLKATATGMANQLAAQMLPALIGISNAMVDTAQSSAFLEGAGKTLSVALQSVMTVGIGVASAFEQAGTWIGASGAAMIAAAQGNFSEARNIVAETVEDLKRMNTEAAAQIAKVWNTETPKAPEGTNKPAAGGGSGGAAGRAGAQEVEELAKRIIEIHSMTLGEQEKLAEDYVKGWLDLERARAAGAIQSDEELVQRRTELADWYQQRATEAQYREQAENLAGIAAGIAAMEEEFATKEELENERYNQQLLALENYKLSEVYVEETYNALKEAAKKKHEENLTSIQAAELAKRYGSEHSWMERTATLLQGNWSMQLQGTAALFGRMSGLMLSQKKKEFELGKKAAIAEALVSTFLGAAKAIGTYGFPLGAIFAALTIAAGMMNVNRIRSQQFQGGGGGATPTFDANPATGLPTNTGGDAGLPSSNLPPAPTSAAATTPRTVNLYMRGTDIYSPENMRDNFVPALNEAIGAGVTVNVRSF